MKRYTPLKWFMFWSLLLMAIAYASNIFAAERKCYENVWGDTVCSDGTKYRTDVNGDTVRTAN